MVNNGKKICRIVYQIRKNYAYFILDNVKMAFFGFLFNPSFKDDYLNLSLSSFVK